MTSMPSDSNAPMNRGIDLDDQPQEQAVSQRQDEDRIPERHADGRARLGVASHVPRQPLERRGQPARPGPGLDHRAVERRDRPLLRLEGLAAGSRPGSAATPAPG